MSEKVNEGFMGVYAPCMQTKCNMMVGHSQFLTILESCPNEKDLYWKWMLKDFTDDNVNIQWCSNLKCGMACERISDYKLLNDVKCSACNAITCFRCGVPSHTPCSCEMADQWEKKNNAESENLTWLKAYTK